MNRLTTAVILLFPAAYAGAQEKPRPVKLTHAAVELLPVLRRGGGAQISPEYGWELSVRNLRISAFGFYVWRHSTGDFMRDTLTVSHAAVPFLGVGSEQGRGPLGGFYQVGAIWRGQETPGFRKAARPVFRYLETAWYYQLAGRYDPQDIVLNWGTQYLPLGRFEIYSEGFYRFHRRAGDYGQPQLLLRHRRLGRVSLGVELEVAGGHVTPFLGLKVTMK